MKRVALARVLFARLLGGSLSHGSPFGLLSFEVMRIIQDEKGRACARFTRSPTRRRVGGSLSQGPSQGSPFGLLSFEVMRDKNGLVKSFTSAKKKILGPANLSCKRLLIFGETLCKNMCQGRAGFPQGRHPRGTWRRGWRTTPHLH